jgi:hypothetical protein
MGGGLFPLLAREFASLAVRLASVAGRLEGLPAVVDAARVALVGLPDRPVSRFHTETAIRQVAGVAELIDDAFREGRDHATSDPAVAAILVRLEVAAGGRAALEAFEAHLRDDVLRGPRARPRPGDLFAAKLRHTLSDLSLLRPGSRAGRTRVRRFGRRWSGWPPTCGLSGAPGAIVRRTTGARRGVLDASRLSTAVAEILDWCRAELARVEAFCRERDPWLADDPLEIRWTPVFMRSFGGAMLDSPGALDRGQKSFFAITPIPEDWSPEQAESYLREDNERMLRLLVIHEAVPGHYLQGAFANRHPSIVRSVFPSGIFAEGWAVYVTQVMMDVGYDADDPALMLVHWKFYLRAVTNAIIDVRIHAGDAFGGAMTGDEAEELMVRGGFQEEAEARAKYDRARLSSTQLVTYFVGSVAMWDRPRSGDVSLRRAAMPGAVAPSWSGSCRADSGPRPGSPIGPISRRSSATGRRRSRSFADSSSTRAESGA